MSSTINMMDIPSDEEIPAKLDGLHAICEGATDKTFLWG